MPHLFACVQLARILRFLRVLQILKMLKIARLARMKNVFSSIEKVRLAHRTVLEQALCQEVHRGRVEESVWDLGFGTGRSRL